MSTSDSVLHPHPAVETAYLPPEAVLYDERTGQVFRLNPSAAAIWMLIDGSADVEGIAREISEIFDVPVDQVRQDVRAAVDQFAGQALLGGDVLPPAENRLRLPARLEVVPALVPPAGEIAVRLRVLTRGGRAVLLHASDAPELDGARLRQAGIAEVESPWAFVSPDGSAVGVGRLRWPLRGVLAIVPAGADTDEMLDTARGMLWPLARGDRSGWERLLDTEGWVRVAGEDVEAALEAVLA